MATMTETARGPQIRQTQCFIGGKWVPAASGKTFDTINPATDEVIARSPRGTRPTSTWPSRRPARRSRTAPGAKMDARDRGRLLQQAGRPDRGEHRRAGRPRVARQRQADPRRRGRRPAADDRLPTATTPAGPTRSTARRSPSAGNYFCYTRHEPVGVVGQIIPWNFPLLMAAWKWGPALAAGCTIVLKPAEQTPLTCLRMARAGPGGRHPRRRHQRRARLRPDRRRGARQASRTSTRSPSPASTRPARSSCATPAQTLKRLTLELGGKSPNIVFADADLDAAVDGRVLRPVLQPGPVLLRRQPAVRRGEGPRPVRREAASRRPRRRKVGDPFDPDDRAGPAGRPGAVRQDHGATSTSGKKEGAKLRHRRQARRRARATSSSRRCSPTSTTT